MDDAAIAALQHQRLHWQETAEALNRQVHAQRDRIRDLEGHPDRLVLRRVVTFLQSARWAGMTDDDFETAKRLAQDVARMLT